MTDIDIRAICGTAGRALGRAAGRALLALFFICPSAYAGDNLEEKLKYERALEQKVEDVLVNLLGPGKSRVMIRAAVDFSSKESFRVEGEKAGGEKAEQRPFDWRDINKPAGRELLPGFFEEPQPPQQATQTATSSSYQREVTFPQAMVKRMTVSLLLSEDIPESDAKKARLVVSELLALDPARGDEILVMRARFAPLWYTPEMMGTLIRYGIVALIAIIGMGIVSLGFLKMASAMRSMAAPESTRIQMEMGAAAGGGEGALNLPAYGEPAAPGAKPVEPGLPAGEPSDGVVFDVRADKLEILVKMLAKDEPADIAIIAVHLPAELRSRFLSLLPPATASEVFANIAKVRFVEPELITRIKSELERRLNGAVGGYGKAMELIEKADPVSQKALIDALQKTHPDIAAQVRTRILMLDALEHFEEKDFDILAGAVPVKVWASAIWRLSEGARGRLKTHLPAGAWQILEQTMKYGAPGAETIDAAVAEVLAAAWKLIGQGRIKKPGQQAAIGLKPAAEPDPAKK